jgi:hypothetical protein
MLQLVVSQQLTDVSEALTVSVIMEIFKHSTLFLLTLNIAATELQWIQQKMSRFLGEMSGSHFGEYEDKLSSGMLHGVVS